MSSSSSFHQYTATNQWALLLGSICIAYSPNIFLFTFIVYPKPQLLILVTSYAFSYLFSATMSSILYTILNTIFQFNHNNNTNNTNDSSSSDNVFSSNGVLAAIIPSIFMQFVLRCYCTSLYHKVERVIQLSIQRKVEEEEEAAARNQTNAAVLGNNNNNNNNNNSTVDAMNGTTTTTNNVMDNDDNDPISSTDFTKLSLSLNDGSAGIAAGIGFGTMHALILYGTFISNEATNNTTGILYQNSCPAIPSLVVSAIMTNLFFILQIFYMLLTFFGMRRRLLYHRGECAEYNEEEEDVAAVLNDNDNRSRNRRNAKKSGRYFGNSRSGGNYALLLVLISHTTASFITLFHRQTNGCYIVLPSLFGIVILTAYTFYIGCGKIYMPNTSNVIATTMMRMEGYQSHSE